MVDWINLRPKWPYDRWKTETELDKDSEHLTNDTCKHVAFECNESDRGVGLRTFLNSFDKDLDVFETEEGLAVQKEINAVLETTVDNLKKNHRLFKPCRLLKAGSVAEGTKVGKMNEFDFLLVLDIFQRKDLFDIYLDNCEMEIRLRPSCEEAKDLVIAYQRYFKILREASSHFSSQNEAETDQRKETNKGQQCIVVMQNIRKCLISMFFEEFHKNLTTDTNWEISKGLFRNKRMCKSDFAATLHLSSEKYNLDVDIDVCFCIPISDDEGGNVKFSKDRLIEVIAPYFGILKSIMEAEPREEVFAIIGEHRFEFGFDKTLTRITIPGLEQSQFLKHGRNSGQVKTYRYAKCIAGRFFPKATKLYGCLRCCHSFVKSYYLKNIIFCMMNNYKDPSFWSDNNVPYRVLEVFDILATCISNPTAKEYESEARLTTFITPGQLPIFRMYNYNLHEPPQNRTRAIHLYEKISDSPLYKPSFLPEYEERMKIDDILIDETVIRYFDVLKNDPWDSFGLILEVRDVLRNMKTKHDVVHKEEGHST